MSNKFYKVCYGMGGGVDCVCGCVGVKYDKCLCGEVMVLGLMR